MTTQTANTRFLAQTPHGFSNVVEVTGGRLVYITGQMAVDDSGNLVGEGDWGVQLEKVFTNLEAQLAVVGAEFRHVVKITVLAEESFMEHAHEFGAIRDKHVNTEEPPASAIFLVSKLVHPGALVDISAIAHLDVKRSVATSGGCGEELG